MRKGITLVELVLAGGIFILLSALLFSVSQTFFQRFFKIESSIARLIDMEMVLTTIGDDVMAAHGDPEKLEELFEISSDSLQLSFFRIFEGKREKVVYGFDPLENCFQRTFSGKTNRIRLSGDLSFSAVPDFFPAENPVKTWLKVEIALRDKPSGKIFHGGEIKIRRNFFPVFLNRKRAGRWISNETGL